MSEFNDPIEDIIDDPSINLIDPATVSPRSVAMKWGLIGGAISIVINLVGYLTGITTPSADSSMSSIGITLLSFVIGLFCVYKAIQEHRDELGGYIRGARCITVGLWSGLFYGLLSAVWAIIFFNFIAPDFFDELYSSMTVMWEEQGLDDEAIETALGMTKMMQGPIAMPVVTILSSLFNGVILAIIPAFILKKKAPGQF